MAKILKKEGTKASVGCLVGIMVEKEEDIAKINIDEIMKS
jgi:hypothetical protein